MTSIMGDFKGCCSSEKKKKKKKNRREKTEELGGIFTTKS